jgi:hypothetical protein
MCMLVACISEAAFVCGSIGRRRRPRCVCESPTMTPATKNPDPLALAPTRRHQKPCHRPCAHGGGGVVYHVCPTLPPPKPPPPPRADARCESLQSLVRAVFRGPAPPNVIDVDTGAHPLMSLSKLVFTSPIDIALTKACSRSFGPVVCPPRHHHDLRLCLIRHTFVSARAALRSTSCVTGFSCSSVFFPLWPSTAATRLRLSTLFGSLHAILSMPPADRVTPKDL